MIGTGEDARGFALAGVALQACDSARDAAVALNAARAPGARVGLVLVTPGLAERAPEAIRAFLLGEPPPALLVLPDRAWPESFRRESVP